MRIILFCATNLAPAGGMEKQMSLLATLLANNNHEVHVAADEVFRHLFAKSITFHPVTTARSRRNPLLLITFIRLIHQLAPDIIHAHGHKAASILGSVRKFLPSFAGLVATSHGIKRKNQALRRFQHIISVSQSVADNLDPLPSKVVENIVILDGKVNDHHQNQTQLIETYRLNPAWPIVASIGRFAKVKGFDKLIEASKGLPINLMLIGDGEEASYLKSIAHESVAFTGYLDITADLVNGIDLLVIASERESFGLTMVEALLSETPVLCPNSIGACDRYDLPDSACLTNNSPSAIREGINRYLSNPESYRSEQSNLFKQAKSLNQPTPFLHKHEDIYQHALKTSKQS